MGKGRKGVFGPDGTMNTIRIIGIGNAFAGDDAIGVLVARQVQDLLLEGVEVIEAGLAGLALLDLMNSAETVILIDAMQSGQPPGTIHRLEIPRDLGFIIRFSWSSTTASTHAFGLGETLALGETLGTLPPRLLVVGIELNQTTLGEEFSPEVTRVIDSVVARIQKEVEHLSCTNSNS